MIPATNGSGLVEPNDSSHWLRLCRPTRFVEKTFGLLATRPNSLATLADLHQEALLFIAGLGVG
jgi:hypothetical protein